MLRESNDRKTCDARLLLALTGILSGFACANASDNAEEDTQTDVEAVAAPMPGGPAPNGVAFPAGVQDWLPIGAAARNDVPGGDLRVIVGNQIAVRAARAGQTSPWPEGSMLSHLVWQAEKNPTDPSGNTVGPGAFKQVTLMVKDTTKYAADGGWAYGVWMGSQLMPPPEGFDRACVNCHTERVSDKDMVFTDPGALPELDAMASAADAPNGVAFPERVLDWRVLGIADILGGNPTLRVIVGNPTAVEAARNGETNPWPDGSMISHYNWAAGSDDDTGEIAVTPGRFNAFTLMQRSAARYEADSNWAFGVWPLGMDGALAPPAAADFDRACVGCHQDNVLDRDMVFTDVAAFPEMMLSMPATAR